MDDVRKGAIDQMVVNMARLIENGDFLAEGIGTFMPNAAYILARRMHAPDGITLCPNGNALTTGRRRMTLGRDERVTTRGSMLIDYADVNLIYMPMLFVGHKARWTEFMRPAQMDAWGWTNNVCIGPYGQPTVRLPGAAGIPDASPTARRLYYYVPRHTPRVLVRELDFASGAGNPRPGQPGPVRPITVVTELCMLKSGGDGRLVVAQLNAGVTRGEAVAATGFELAIAPDVGEAAPPTKMEQALLDREIDPLGLRYLEALSGAARREAIRTIAALEQRT
jgi:glutaconate CoA-transferase, subunit B